MNRQALIRRLQSKNYRQAYVASRIKTDLAFQIRLLREARGWTQADLARELGVTQPRVAQMEDPSYGKFSSQTLQKLAAVFDVALVQRFAPFSELADWSSKLSETTLCPPGFEQDTFDADEVHEAAAESLPPPESHARSRERNDKRPPESR